MITRSIAVLAACGLFAACASDPPNTELAQARGAIVEAQAANADAVAPDSLTSAQQKLAKAEMLADDGKEDEARLLAQEARADANASLAAAKQRKAESTEQELAATEAEKAALAAQLAEMQAKETERGYVVTLGDVLFATDSADLTLAGRERVAQIVSYLRANPGEAVIIEGHTDAIGDAAYNQQLSEARAETVTSVILSSGIATPRVVFTGLGESAPVASNATSVGRQLNRRVDVIFVDRG